ncbi:MAG TPA: type II toxin-antitoxin system VapC family toxin [Candidatus Binatia bacterium]|nr:type II toxin-antitoxin system VapC family toxin [Candidatus Binatia bacterium]
MIVLDTHAWIWSVSKPTELSRVARRRIGAETRIGVSAISCLEVATLVAKGRISLDREPLEWLEQALALPKIELLPLTPAIAVKATQLGTDFPGDPADRIITATSILEPAALVTKDSRIRDYASVNTVW